VRDLLVFGFDESHCIYPFVAMIKLMLRRLKPA